MGDTVIDASIVSGFRTVKHSTSIPCAMREMPELDDASLGDIVRYLRLQRGLTQTDLAHELDMSQKWVSDIERGIYKHSTVETIRDIAEFFDFPEHVLIVKAGFGKSRENADYILSEADPSKMRARRKQSIDEMHAEAIALIPKVNQPADLEIVLMTLRRFARVR